MRCKVQADVQVRDKLQQSGVLPTILCCRFCSITTGVEAASALRRHAGQQSPTLVCCPICASCSRFASPHVQRARVCDTASAQRVQALRAGAALRAAQDCSIPADGQRVPRHICKRTGSSSCSSNIRCGAAGHYAHLCASATAVAAAAIYTARTQRGGGEARCCKCRCTYSGGRRLLVRHWLRARAAPRQQRVASARGALQSAAGPSLQALPG